MKSLSLAKIGGAFFLAGLALACLSLAVPEGLSPMKAASDTPTFILNAEKNHLTEEASFSGTATITSEAGTEIEVSYGLLEAPSEGCWNGFATGAFFYNSEKISGLASLSFVLDEAGSFIIRWDNEKIMDTSSSAETIEASAGTEYTCNFNNEYPGYFLFQRNAGSEGILYVRSVTITFTCSDVNQ